MKTGTMINGIVLIGKFYVAGFKGQGGESSRVQRFKGQKLKS
jgi:hypothetical protein